MGKQKDISLDNSSFAADIKQLNLYGIEWCNIPDYLESRKFVKFAKACSGEDTIHTLDVMNWQYRIFGVSWTDYISDKPWTKETYYRIKKETEAKNTIVFNMRS